LHTERPTTVPAPRLVEPTRPFSSGICFRGQRLQTTVERSRQMTSVRRSGTGAELAARAAARSAGLRFTVDNSDLPGSPDLANRARRIAVFVHGCYWHRHSGCPRTTTPTTNRAFWLDKFATNQARDRRVARTLRTLGYRVIVIWECRTRNREQLARRFLRIAAEARMLDKSRRRA
jgi:DNA mismatch endonuclease (patch repair protein)